MAKKVDGVIVEKYLWANLTTLLAVYDANDTLVQRFEYADNRMPIAMTQNGSKYYLHYDQVGSLRAVSDTNHNILKEITYDSYGNILSETNPSFRVPFGFAGGLYDSDTKLTRFGYRDYDAYTGKWTAKDPILFGGGDSNLYGYVLGDPVGGIDPDGLVAVADDIIIITILSGVATWAIHEITPHVRNLVREWDNWLIFPTDEDDSDVVCLAKKSGKEKASDAPSWAKSQRPSPNQKCQDFAKQILNAKYGEGNWNTGAATEYNKIVKWCQRSLK